MYQIYKTPDAFSFSNMSFNSTDEDYINGKRATTMVTAFATTYAQDLMGVHVHIDTANIVMHMEAVAGEVDNSNHFNKLKTAHEAYLT